MSKTTGTTRARIRDMGSSLSWTGIARARIDDPDHVASCVSARASGRLERYVRAPFMPLRAKASPAHCDRRLSIHAGDRFEIAFLGSFLYGMPGAYQKGGLPSWVSTDLIGRGRS